MNWQPLELLSDQFAANVVALSTRDAALAGRLAAHAPDMPYRIAADGDQIRLSRVDGGALATVPARLHAAGARQVVRSLCPAGHYAAPVLVAGIDQGWLWRFLHDLPSDTPTCPGYRAAMFLLARELEELWVAAHVHDLRGLLADPRALIFVGNDAIAQLTAHLLANRRTALPKLSVTLDAALWPAGTNLEALTADIAARLIARQAAALGRLDALYAGVTDPAVAAKLRSGAPLRVMGITARFTTFLQHSMRDWLAAFDDVGHETRLVIEDADHEQLNSLVLAEASVQFRPDLILLIDHFRAELGGLPANCPAVMWVQDYLPNIFKPTAGAAQGPFDFAIGHNQVECTTRFNYPRGRFMPAVIPVNPARFQPRELSAADAARFACDVAFVSHASAAPEAITADAVEKNAEARPILVDAFERLKAVYDGGRFLTHPLHLRAIIEQAAIRCRLAPDEGSMGRLVDLFTYRINNAFFRQQALEWAAELGVDLRLYGNGWERHPRLARFARGPADNAAELATIYRASRVNLQVTPHGVMHQRLLEGLCSGGFFLARYVAGDVIDRIYKPLWEWCVEQGVETDEHLMQRATPGVFKLLGELQRTLGLDPLKLGMPLTDDVRLSHDIGYLRSPAFWPEYDAIRFETRSELQGRISHFLKQPEERAELARSMRERVVGQLSYRATSGRMLEFIAAHLESRAAPLEAAA